MYFIEKTKSINFFKQFDYMLFFTVILFSIFGVIVLGSAVNTFSDSESYIKKQVISIVIGVVVALILSVFDYKDFRILGVLFYLISIALLVYVLYRGVGKEEWGSSSWIVLPGGLSLQPSELAKIAYVVFLSTFLERIKEGNKVKSNIIKFSIYAVIPVALVLKQPDYGTAMVFIFMLCVMVFVAGIRYRYILFAGCAFLMSTPFIWKFVLNESRRNRILVFLFPGSDPTGASYQIDRARMAIGSGRIFGSGLYNGLQSQNEYASIPIKESDFIFAVIGEELGFIGAVSTVVVVMLILFRCLYIAKNSRDNYGAFLVSGLTGMMGFHFVENIGMNVGLLPVTGIPLPFVSAGGSAMITNYIAIGIILSVSIRKKKAIFNSSQ